MQPILEKNGWLDEPPVIETENYIVKALSKEYGAELFTFLSDKKTMMFITPHPVQSIEEVQKNIVISLAQFQSKKEIPWVILNKENGELIGMFRFHKVHVWHRKAEMGAVIKKAYQNKGVMTEVFEKVLEFGFLTLGLNRIVGDIFEGNEGSEKLLLKFAFKKEGQLRQTDFDGERYHDTIVYSLLRPEYT
ncbi:GNAT family N-acetyltransferase [Bacillus sp. DJP31]|uniref:GNAT family N-acetyltransferase n=1 Tax=Bacillus sp. DJP31 TaxID=3409789 RepID=UPI003BB725AB